MRLVLVLIGCVLGAPSVAGPLSEGFNSKTYNKDSDRGECVKFAQKFMNLPKTNEEIGNLSSQFPSLQKDLITQSINVLTVCEEIYEHDGISAYFWTQDSMNAVFWYLPIDVNTGENTGVEMFNWSVTLCESLSPYLGEWPLSIQISAIDLDALYRRSKLTPNNITKLDCPRQ